MFIMEKQTLEEKIENQVIRFIKLNKPFDWIKYILSIYYKKENRTEEKYYEAIDFCLDEYNKYVKEKVLEDYAKQVSLINTTLYYSKRSLIDQD